MPTFAALVAYDGALFSGFQRQSAEKGPTVQGAIEVALERLTGEATAVTAAGRTDSGVHATGQVIGFTSAAEFTSATWRRALNALVPEDVAIRAVCAVGADFHARRSALSRRYSYRLLCDSVRSPLAERYAWRRAGTLDVEAMNRRRKRCSASTTSARSGRVRAIAAPRGFVGIRCARCSRRSVVSGREVIPGRATAR